MRVAKNQTNEVLEYLLKFGSITPLDAIRELGCERLASRIWDLRHMGHVIETENEPHTARSGRQGYHARYVLKKEGANET